MEDNTTDPEVNMFCDERTQALAKQLLSDGTAVSEQQAEQIAAIALCPTLSPAAKAGLYYMALRKGADFDAGELTQDDIADATDFAVQFEKQIALSLMAPAGSA